MYNSGSYMPMQPGVNRLIRERDNLDATIQSLQNQMNYANPINNNFSNVVNNSNLYELRKLKDGEEANNILVNTNTIFIGIDRMEIKQVDGTLTKFKIKQYFPVDEKDEKIDQLTKKIEELEMKLNESKPIESNQNGNESTSNDAKSIESESKKNSRRSNKQ